MFRRVPQSCIVNLKQIKCVWPPQRSVSSTASVDSKEKWNLYAGVLVERLPVVSKSLNSLEKQFQEHLWQVEFENSLKSDNELQHEREVLQAELIKKGKMEVELDDAMSKQTAQDLRDAYSEEFKKFQFASRTTVDDEANNMESNNRRLEEILYLVTEHTLGNKKHLLLPQGPRAEGETMRQAAERVLREKCGDGMKVSFYGNAPCGFYKYKYPSAMRNETVGAKVFFYRAALQQGNVDTKVTKMFEWLEKSALEGKLQNTVYNESVQKFML